METLKAKPGRYVGERVFLFPYSPAQAPFSTADGPVPELLGYLYDQTKRDGLLELLFAGEAQPSKNTFIVKLFGKAVVVAFKLPVNGETAIPVGYGWLENVEIVGERKKASCSFAMFKSFWGREEVTEAGEMTLHFWFNELGLDVLFGPMLKRNELAKRFAEELGFKTVAEIPQFFLSESGFEDCTLLMLSKADFTDRYGIALPAQEVASGH